MKIILAICIFSNSALASGILTTSAKVDSFDEKTITLRLADSRMIKINRNLIPEDQQKSMTANSTLNLNLDEKLIRDSVVKPKKK